MKFIVGVMGPGNNGQEANFAAAYTLGRLIAEEGWVLLCGGENWGVMDAASRGAKAGGGLTVGILPSSERSSVSEAIDIPILTDLGLAGTNINAIASDVMVACGTGLVTSTEISLALSANRTVILLGCGDECYQYFSRFTPDNLLVAVSPEDAIRQIKEIHQQSTKAQPKN